MRKKMSKLMRALVDSIPFSEPEFDNLTESIKEDIVEWCKNISENYIDGTDTNIYSQLVDAEKEYPEVGNNWDMRLQHAGDEDYRDYKMLYFVFTGDSKRFGKFF